MSKVEDMPKPRSQEIVRLKIDGTRTAVNTLREQQTAKGVALICPFPALEVDIPASFGSDDEMVFGNIHRIGVEDDPETGLPRLRLQVRTHDTRETTIQPATASILQEAGSVTTVPEADPENDVPVESIPVELSPAESSPVESIPVELPEGDGPFFDFGQDVDKDGLFNKTDIFYGAPDGYGQSQVEDQPDPDWVGCQEFPAPEDFQQRMKTRRRYKAVKYAVLAFVVGMVAATGYTLNRAGIVKFDAVKDRLAVLSMGEDIDTPAPAVVAEPAPLLEEPAPVTPEKAEPAAVAEETVAVATADESYAPTASSYANDAVPTAEAEAEAAGQPAPADNPLAAKVETVSASAAPTPTPAAEEAPPGKDITLTLPTRWPVEYTTAYRVRDPNGVVVDVPGGLVKREGWLDMAQKFPLIRSIKAIQRENGARFIVYVHGDLPRFMTSPKTGGVSLRLYYDEPSEKTTTVAIRD